MISGDYPASGGGVAAEGLCWATSREPRAGDHPICADEPMVAGLPIGANGACEPKAVVHPTGASGAYAKVAGLPIGASVCGASPIASRSVRQQQSD